MSNRKVAIPKILHEFHGKKAAISDLVATYLAACIAGIIIFGLMPEGLAIWQQVLLLLIAIDIGGGVVANFTEGTTEYHSNHPALRLFFIAPLHLIHPVILALIFPDKWVAVTVNSALIILSAYSINAVKDYALQKIVAPLLMSLAIGVIFISRIPITIISYLLILFSIKLILAYAVRWAS